MKYQKGFTLIELVLVIGIIAIVSTFGFNIINQLTNTRNFDSSVDDFVNLIYEAKSNTLSQVKVNGSCATTDLIGYRIDLDNTADPIAYSMSIVCGTDVNTPSSWVNTQIKSGTMPSDVSADISPASNFMFVIPNALVSERVEININYADQGRSITVATTGAVFR